MTTDRQPCQHGFRLETPGVATAQQSRFPAPCSRRMRCAELLRLTPQVTILCLVIIIIIMVALCNRAHHYIFALWLLSIFFYFLA